jgi:anti-sigma factor RsiW
MSDEDAELVALIDNELDETRKKALLARLEADERLRERYEALREAGAPICAAFDALLEQAPLERLRARLLLDSGARAPSGRFAGMAFRELAAGFVLGLVAAGVAGWLAFGLPRSREDEGWRAAVVDYMKLYTNDTFAFISPDRPVETFELSAVGKKVGADLTPDNVKMPGLDFKVAFNLSYDGAPLGEIAYVDSTGAPVLFCVIANKEAEADAPLRSEKRDQFSLASWSRNGLSYLVIGRMPEQRVAEFAQTLVTRF